MVQKNTAKAAALPQELNGLLFLWSFDHIIWIILLTRDYCLASHNPICKLFKTTLTNTCK